MLPPEGGEGGGAPAGGVGGGGGSGAFQRVRELLSHAVALEGYDEDWIEADFLQRTDVPPSPPLLAQYHYMYGRWDEFKGIGPAVRSMCHFQHCTVAIFFWLSAHPVLWVSYALTYLAPRCRNKTVFIRPPIGERGPNTAQAAGRRSV